MIKTISESFSITVASGVGTTTTTDFKPLVHSGGKIKRIVITPPSESSKHSFYIDDPNSERIYKAGKKVGTTIIDREITVETGTQTLGFLHETDNGSYTVRLVFDLNW